MSPPAMKPKAMTRRRGPALDEALILSSLDTILHGAIEGSAWAPAIRAAELLGRHIGMWRGDGKPQASLADMIRDAAVTSSGDEEPGL